MTDRIISVDWGTTSLRVRLVEADGTVAGEVATADGARTLANAGDRAVAYRAVLTTRLRELRDRTGATLDGLPVLVSGMASSSIGWRELPYEDVPVGVDGDGLHCEDLPALDCDGASLPVTLISGLRTATDVLRGEEMEIVGLLQAPACAPYRDSAWLVLPGTHSKHVRILTGRIVDFATFMTGELFDLLATHSVLAHSVRMDPAEPADAAAQDAAFAEGVEAAGRQPLPHALFRARTRQLLDGVPPALNRAWLDGLLIGAEAHALRAAWTPGTPVLLCARGLVATRYRQALTQVGLPCASPADDLLARAVPLAHLTVAARRGKS